MAVAVEVLQGVAIAAPVVLGASVRRPREVQDVRDDAAVGAARVGVDDDLGLGVTPEVGDVQRGVVLARRIDTADRADIGVGQGSGVEERRPRPHDGQPRVLDAEIGRLPAQRRLHGAAGGGDAPALVGRRDGRAQQRQRRREREPAARDAASYAAAAPSSARRGHRLDGRLGGLGRLGRLGALLGPWLVELHAPAALAASAPARAGRGRSGRAALEAGHGLSVRPVRISSLTIAAASVLPAFAFQITKPQPGSSRDQHE